MAITLRAASDDDAAFLLQVYSSTRADEMALVPWNDEQKEAFLRFQFDSQHNFYREKAPHASYDIILEDDSPIGRLYVRRDEDEIRIMDITVLPQSRNRGVGTSLVRKVLAEGAETDKPVCIWVEFFNPSMRLFERLGFSKTQEDGVNWLMEWRAQT
jgi:RimJ/RimL family protein N-acetyltransferase